MSDNSAPLALYYHNRLSAWIQGVVGAVIALLGLAFAVMPMLPRDMIGAIFSNPPPKTDWAFHLFLGLLVLAGGTEYVVSCWRILTDRSVQLELSADGIVDHRGRNSVTWSEIQSGALILTGFRHAGYVVRLKLVRDKLPQTIDINVDRLSKSPWAIHARMKQIAGWA